MDRHWPWLRPRHLASLDPIRPPSAGTRLTPDPRSRSHRSAALCGPLVLAAVLGAAAPLAAQPADTIRRQREPLFHSRDALLAAGFAAATVVAYPLDKRLADYIQGTPQTNRWLRRTAIAVEEITVPGAFIIGVSMYGVGRLRDNRELADVGLHGTEAILIGTAVTHLIKVTAGRARPFVNRDRPHDYGFGRGLRKEEYRSFPSGHTLIAFAAAAAVTDETRRFWPQSVWYMAPAMYGGAALVGLSRMYDNKHWASDVLVGAAIGVFSGRKVVRYHHTRPDNRVDRWLLGVSVTPGPEGGRLVRPIVIP
jgi:membrane-associated phospholipid phosphatase